MISLDPYQRAHHDFEGGSALNLKTVGAYRWMTHPSCQCWMMSWRIGPIGPVSRWHPGDADPVALLNHVYEGKTLVAHNAAFERDFWNLVIRRKYAPHWPELHLEQQDCTLARASTLALPAGLDFVTKVLGTDAHKDSDGSKLMVKMARPRKILESGEMIWWNEPANITRLGTYCDADIEAETSVDMKLLPHTERERAVWEMDQRINSRGVKLDRNLIEHMMQTVAYAKKDLDAQMRELTDGAVATCGQVAKLAAWISARGVPCTSIAKGEQAELIVAAEELGDGVIADVIKLRGIASKSSTAKLQAMLNWMGDDDRARYLLFYHGTIGGRWAGRGIQPHNLYQVDQEEDGNDIKLAIDLALCAGPPEAVHSAIDTIIGPPMVAIARSMRSMFIPSDGKRFIGGDKSNIEGRINAWLAGEEWKLQAFRDYDAGIGADLYRLSYSRSFGVSVADVTGPKRQVGKVQELSLGYQGAVGAILKMAKNKGIDLRPLVAAVREATSAQDWDKMAALYGKARNRYGLAVERWTALALVVKGFRDANPAITQGWWDLQDAAIEAIDNPGEIVPVFNGRIRYMFARGFMWCSLPSHRLIAYCNPAVTVNDESYIEMADGTRIDVAGRPVDEIDMILDLDPDNKLVDRTKRQATYEGYDGEKKIWGRFALYGGMQCAHVVSATARDALVEDMFEAERRGYSIVLDVHDEILTEMDYGKGTAEELQEIMCRQPVWIDDQALPLAAKCWVGDRYNK